MSKYFKKDEQQAPTERKEGCEAHGCPMNGTTTGCTKPDEFSKWYCRFHLGARHDDFHAITEKLKEFINILKYSHVMRVTPDIHVEALVRNFKDETYNKKPDENYLQYSGRLNAIVNSAIRAVKGI